MITPTPDQAELISRYIQLLKAYNSHTNIYSEKAYDHLDFHTQDCIILSELIPKNTRTLVDMGSGSGLPSIILAIMRPEISVAAVESKSRKTLFLSQVKDTLSLENLTIHQEDIHIFARRANPAPDIITAKAFAPYDKATVIAETFSKAGTRLFIPISQRQFDSLSEIQSPQFTLLQPEPGFQYLRTIF